MPSSHSKRNDDYRPRQSSGFRGPTRRALYAIVAVVFVLGFIWTAVFVRNVASSARAVAELSKTSVKSAADLIPTSKLPKLYNVFGDVAHQPPEQADSSHGKTKWYSASKWLHPFSSETTLDEQRAVLPTLNTRIPIYTYYDDSVDTDIATRKAEHKLLLTWRRAWWAQGFKPVILGKPDAMKHSQYSAMQRMKTSGVLEQDLLRWLAWGHMGGGLLANWLALPMASYNDQTLSSLRRGSFTALTMYKGLSHGLLSGPASDIDALIKKAISGGNAGTTTHITDLVPSAKFETATKSDGIAFYDRNAITSNYNKVATELTTSQASGLNLLDELINAHLHIIWQGTFPEGIAVIQSHPSHMTTLVEPAIRLARALVQCPETSMPETCPPNKPTCTPCVSTSATNLDFSTPPSFRNRTSQFTIGTVPHPYTFNMLHHMREHLDVGFIRRDTERDLWMRGTTAELLGDKIGGPQRLTCIKEAVAGRFGMSHSLWMTPELADPIEVDWIFGFALNPVSAKSTSGVAPKQGAFVPSSSQLAREKMLLELAKERIIQNPEDDNIKMVEGWNMADAEAWRFVNAYTIRRRLEREKWLQEESQFAGADDISESFM